MNNSYESEGATCCINEQPCCSVCERGEGNSCNHEVPFLIVSLYTYGDKMRHVACIHVVSNTYSFLVL